MLTPKTITINGTSYTIGQLPADLAYETACVVAEWRGKNMAALGEGLGGLGDTVAGTNVVAASWRSNASAAKMLRDREYRTLVSDRVLGMCSAAGVPVLREDWTTRFAGNGLADLHALHLAAIEHSCGPFLQALGAGGPASQAAE